MTRATHKLTCSGDTKPSRHSLKERGWKWDPDTQHWYMMLVDPHAQRIIDGDTEFFRGLGGHLKGCRLTLDGIVRWTSKTYREAVSHDSGSDQDGYGWNCDAFGNRVKSSKIAGSSPDDRV